MSGISKKAEARVARVRAEVAAKFPGLRRPALVQKSELPAWVLGVDENGRAVEVPWAVIERHLFVGGATGGGKSFFLKNGFRQLVVSSECGLGAFDPHGNHPDSVHRDCLGFMHQHQLLEKRVVHVVDPNVISHVTGMNPLVRRDPLHDARVIAGNFLSGLGRVWDEDTDAKPTMRRVLAAVASALCELGLTLAEFRFILNIEDRFRVREWMTAEIKKVRVREELEYLQEMNSRDLRTELIGPRNRLAKLMESELLECMFGQHTKCIDWIEVLDGRHIVLANLSSGPQSGQESSQMVGCVMLRDIYEAAKQRKHPERPFVLMMDESHLYITSDVEHMLAELRKYGVFVVAATQSLWQLELAGEEIARGIKSNANNKVIFPVNDDEEAVEYVGMVRTLTGQLANPASIRPTVVGQVKEVLHGSSAAQNKSLTKSDSETEGTTGAEVETEMHSVSEGDVTSDGLTHSVGTNSSDSATSLYPGMMMPPQQPMSITTGTGNNSGEARTAGTAHVTQQSYSQSIGKMRGWNKSKQEGKAETAGETKTESANETYRSIFRDLPTQFFTIEDERYLEGQRLTALERGHAFYSLRGKRIERGVLRVPTIEKCALPEDEHQQVLIEVLDRSPSAKRREAAIKELSDRQRSLCELAQLLPPEPEQWRTTRARPAKLEAKAKPLPAPKPQSTRKRVPIKKPELDAL